MIEEEGINTYLGNLSDLEEWCKNQGENDINCIFLNVRSLKSNLDQLKGYFKNVIDKLHVIGLCEVNISERRIRKGLVNMSWFEINGFTYEKKLRQKRKGGGIMVFVKEGIKYEIHKMETLSFENIAMTVETERGKLEVWTVYRPPKKNKNEFFQEFKEKLAERGTQKPRIVMGDFNLKFKNPTSNDIEFYNNLANEGIDIGIDGITREVIEKNRRGIMTLKQSSPDNILIGLEKEDESETAIIRAKISDHYILGIRVKENEGKKKEIGEQSSPRENTKKVAIHPEKIMDELQNIDWLELNDEKNNVTEMYEKLDAVFQSAYEKAKIEVKKKVKKKEENPWMTEEIVRKMKERDAIFKKWKKFLYSDYYREKYNKIRNEINKSIKKAKNKYYRNKLEKGQGDGRKTWNVIYEMIGGKNKMDVDYTIEKNLTSETKNIQDVAEEMAIEFRDEIRRLEHVCEKKLCEEETSEVKTNARLGRITPREVEKLIENMDEKKGAGVDGMRMKDIKKCLPQCVPLFANLINKSIEEGVIPTKLKQAIVRPIFKGGDKKSYTNYRPISILNSAHKIMEKHIANVLTKYLQENNIINKNQFGFQRGKNTTQLLTKFSNNIYEAMENGDYTLSLFVDFKKAFDTLPHKHILKSLKKIGIEGKLYAWLKNYLQERTYRVKIKEKLSSEIEIESGVPQGSYLGPILYIIFTNSLANKLTKLGVKYYMYADDTCVLIRGKSLAEIQRKGQEVIDVLQKWAHDNGIIINKKKTCYMVIRDPRKKLLGNAWQMIFHSIDCLHSEGKTECQCNEEVMRVTKTKYLGVTVDDKLSWGEHVKAVCIKLRKCLVAITRMTGKSSAGLKRLVYTALGESHINYAIPAWGMAKKVWRRKIAQVQKRIIRKFTRPGETITNTRKKYGILTVEARYVHQLAVAYYWDKDLKEVSGARRSVRLLKRGKQRNLKIIKVKNNYGKMTHRYIVPKIWERLPDDMLGFTSYAQIKNKFRIWLQKKEGRDLIKEIFNL